MSSEIVGSWMARAVRAREKSKVPIATDPARRRLATVKLSRLPRISPGPGLCFSRWTAEKRSSATDGGLTSGPIPLDVSAGGVARTAWRARSSRVRSRLAPVTARRTAKQAATAMTTKRTRIYPPFGLASSRRSTLREWSAVCRVAAGYIDALVYVRLSFVVKIDNNAIALGRKDRGGACHCAPPLVCERPQGRVALVVVSVGT